MQISLLVYSQQVFNPLKSVDRPDVSALADWQWYSVGCRAWMQATQARIVQCRYIYHGSRSSVASRMSLTTTGVQLRSRIASCTSVTCVTDNRLLFIHNKYAQTDADETQFRS